MVPTSQGYSGVRAEPEALMTVSYHLLSHLVSVLLLQGRCLILQKGWLILGAVEEPCLTTQLVRGRVGVGTGLYHGQVNVPVSPPSKLRADSLTVGLRTGN